MRSMVKINKILLFLLLISLSKGIIWTVTFPVFQGPDEPAYISYVQFLAENKSVPRPPFVQPGDGVSPQLDYSFKITDFEKVKFNTINHQSFADNKEDFGLEEKSLIKSQLDPKPQKAYAGYAYSPLYPLLNVPLYLLFKGHPLRQFFAMRILSTILSLVLIVFVYLTGEKIFKQKSTAFITALLVSFQPMISHVSSLVHIDVLLNMAFGGFFYYASILVANNTNKRKDWLRFWIWSLLAFFSKIHGYFVLIFILLILGMKYRKKIFSNNYYRLILAGILVSLGLFIKKHLWPGFISAWERLGPIYGQHDSVWLVKNVVIKWFLRPIYVSFWANFGWEDTLVEKSYYIIIAGLLLIAIIGLIWHFWQVFLKKTWAEENNKLLIFYLISISFLTITYFFVSLLQFSEKSVALEFTQGRYFFMVIIPIFMLLMKGWLTIIPKRWQFVSLFGLVFLMIFFNVISLAQYVIPRYYI